MPVTLFQGKSITDARIVVLGPFVLVTGAGHAAIADRCREAVGL